jgi:iron complex transport system permease protein
LTLFSIALIICDLCFGSINLFSLEKSDPLFSTILFDIRLPKTLTSIIAGSGLALCGLLMQSLFRNPLAGPYVLGVSSGSSLFVAIATMLISSINVSGLYFMGKSIVTLFSIGGAFFVTLIILIISKKNKSNVTVLLVGLMLGQILGAMQGMIEYISSADNLKTFIMWGMGSVGSTTLQDLYFVIPIYAVAIITSFFFIKPLNAILLNEQYAQNLGVNVNKLRLAIIIITAVLVGVITAFCGPIAFVGISVPIASRLFFKTSHHLHQMVFCLLLGACVVLSADVICQLLSTQFMLPINTVTTLIGSPVVIYLLFKSKLSIG